MAWGSGCVKACFLGFLGGVRGAQSWDFVEQVPGRCIQGCSSARLGHGARDLEGSPRWVQTGCAVLGS